MAPDQIKQHQASVSDVDWLIALRQLTMGPHLRSSGKPLTLDEDKAKVLGDFERIKVLSIGRERVGMIKVVKNRLDWILVQIQLLPEFQNRGLGTILLKDLLSKAYDSDVSVSLKVLRVNPAKRLYERLGFVVVDENDWSFDMRYPE